jgi:hypothetical protein
MGATKSRSFCRFHASGFVRTASRDNFFISSWSGFLAVDYVCRPRWAMNCLAGSSAGVSPALRSAEEKLPGRRCMSHSSGLSVGRTDRAGMSRLAIRAGKSVGINAGRPSQPVHRRERSWATTHSAIAMRRTPGSSFAQWPRAVFSAALRAPGDVCLIRMQRSKRYSRDRRSGQDEVDVVRLAVRPDAAHFRHER